MPAPTDPEKRKQWKERLSKAGKGRKPWNTGKNLKDDPEYADYVDKLRNTLANAERGPMSDEQKQKISNTLTGKMKGKRIGFANGHKHSDESKRKMSESRKGKKRGPMSDEQKAKVADGVNKFYEEHPEHKELLSKRIAAAYEDPEVRAKSSASIKAYYQTEEGQALRQKLSELLTERQTGSTLSEEHKQAISAANKEYFNQPHIRQELSDRTRSAWANSDIRAKMLENLIPALMNITNSNFITGTHQSPKAGDVRYRSSYELAVYKQLDVNDDVTTYEAEPFSIPYEFNGTMHSYFPDILITFTDNEQLLVEVKPNHKLDDPQNIAKFSAAQQQFGDRFEIWSEELIFQ